MSPDHLTLIITRMDGGGMERFAATLCNTLLAQGRGVSLVSMHVSPEEGGKCWLDPRLSYRELGLPARRAAVALRRLCAEHPNQPVLALGSEIAWVLLGLKALGMISNPLCYRESTAMLRHIPNRILRFHRFLLAHVDGLVAQTQAGLADAEALVRLRGARLVLPNPCPRVQSVKREPVATSGEDELNVFVIGRLESVKGQERVIRAIPGLRSRFPGLRLHLVGRGSCEARLRELCAELDVSGSVVFSGFMSDPESAYLGADVVILPSDYEGLPNVLLEAVAHGCRVLSSDGAGGIGETMQVLGLEEFQIPLRDFEENLPDGIARVLSADPTVWEAARARLGLWADPEEVADRLWAFVLSLRKIE